jgi:signal transduction histidine kinase
MTAKDGTPPSQPEPAGRFSVAREWLHTHRPRFRDRHFWAIQGLILAIVALHYLTELNLVLPELEGSIFIPVTLFFIPVVYAGMKFGFVGTIATGVWVSIITIPNLILFHRGLSLLGETSQLLIVNAAAVFLGYWVSREKAARQRAKAYAMHVVDAQEKERQRIARDLHDESVQTLVLLCRELDALKSSQALLPPAMETLQKARKTAEAAAAGLRDFARELRPPILDDFGMVAAIRKLLMDFMDRAGINGQLTVAGGERRLPADLELGMFRISQEAISNVEHHAGATNVAVVIAFADKDVSLDIQDNGRGFIVPVHAESVVIGDSLGLVGMKERAELLGGRLEIQSSLGKGTRIKASIPLDGTGAG